MTDDLVKRLRYEQDRLDDEAADRIEQLEAALQKISDLDCYIDDGKQFHIGYFGEIARAALGEKKDD
jgi:hypothetical protein